MGPDCCAHEAASLAGFVLWMPFQKVRKHTSYFGKIALKNIIFFLQFKHLLLVKKNPLKDHFPDTIFIFSFFSSSTSLCIALY